MAPSRQVPLFSSAGADPSREVRGDEGLVKAPPSADFAAAPASEGVAAPADASGAPTLFPSAVLSSGSPPARWRGAPVRPALLRPAHLAVADKLPRGVRLGTSSWSFPGWSGLVWEGSPGADKLAAEGLRAYAAHPLLRAVGLDRTHYRPMAAAALQALAVQVPADFRFLVKAHEDSTLARFPGHARYGARRDQPNPLFLDPGYAIDRVVGPAVEGLGAKLGVLLFQFAPQPLATLGGVGGLVERLQRFLEALPQGVPVAVEVRNSALLVPSYAEALASVGAIPVLSAWSGLPPIEEQLRRTGAGRAPLRVIRWMLQEGASYEDSVDRYAPFDALVDPDPVTRAAIARIVAGHTGETIVIVNNKAEGSAPRSVFALAEAIAAAGGEPFRGA